MYVGNPILILCQKAFDILFEEFTNIHYKDISSINKETIEEFVKSSKKRIRKELNREITITIPFLEKATEEDLVNIKEDFLLSWLTDSTFKLEEKLEDKEIQELFNTFPIEDFR